VTAPIDLSSAEAIPSEPLSRLQAFRGQLRGSRSLESLLENRAFLAIARDLNEHCEREGVIGYHYTRSFPERIVANGLTARTGAERRNEFLAEHGHRFSAAQRSLIEPSWASYFDRGQDRARDGKVWFCLTLKELRGSGTDRLLGHFGGEVVYKAFREHSEIASVLASIGEPLVVTCAVPAYRASTTRRYPWGSVWLSAYHRTLNANAEVMDCDCWLLESVPPERIIRVQHAGELGWVGPQQR